MKPYFISPKSTCLGLAMTGFALSLQAIPIPITGAISFSGTSTIDGVNFISATKFMAFQDVFVGAPSAVSGSYVGTSGAAVTVTPFTWSPPTASTPINPLWTFVVGSLTYSFDLSVLHVDTASLTGILLSGAGTAHITGIGSNSLDTTGNWDFSAQTLGLSTFTFSSSTVIPPTAGVLLSNVPDGGTTVTMLGASLLGLGLIGRKRTDLKN